MARTARKLSETGYLHLIVRGIGRQVLFEDRDAYATLKGNEYYSLPRTTNNYCASSRHRLIRQDGSEYKTPVNTSYAAPSITAAITNYIKEHPGKDLDFIAD